MFIDSDSNGGSFGTFDTDQDDVYSNHPGFLKDFFKPKKAESERYEEEKNSQKSKCNYGAGDSCAELQDCLDYFQGIYNANTGNTRVPERKRKASNYHMGKVKEYLAVRECSTTFTTTSEIDQSKSDETDAKNDLAAIQEQIEQVVSDSSKSQKETFQQAQRLINAQQLESDKKNKTLMIAGGSLVAILLLVVIVK
jgi:hypothetical protein|tara:strand:+ start:3849 stop:4436 length:588 start_codon:yes stop_codon:yes gene_type:complete